MLNPRIIPCLLVKDKGLVKTINFKNPKYVGDPINAVRIFNEKEVDELIVLDIDATVEKRGPDYKMIEHFCNIICISFKVNYGFPKLYMNLERKLFFDSHFFMCPMEL